MALTDFLLARIAEDEAVARAATGGDRTGNWWLDPDEGGVSEVSCLDVQGFITAVDVDAAHVVQHSPARVLAECEAKRRMIDQHVRMYPPGMSPPHLWLKYLATVYSDHPDYREEWSP